MLSIWEKTVHICYSVTSAFTRSGHDHGRSRPGSGHFCQIRSYNFKRTLTIRIFIFFYFQELLKASDQAGSVDLSNFMKLWQQFKATVNEDGDDTEEEIKQAFKDYDRDGDGYITKDEMMNVRISLKVVLIKLQSR